MESCKDSPLGRAASGFLCAAFAILALAPAPGPSAASTSFGDWPDVFDPLNLRTLHLELAPSDWATVQNDASLSIEVPAYFHEAGETPILVSVRRKSGDPLDAVPGFTKVSLKIDINAFVTGQGWHGLKKLSLENGDDNDVVAEGMAWQLERLASGTQGYGYPVGHFAWVRLFINGVDTGVYVNVEQPDKRFLENRGLYVQGQTWLYKVSEVNGTLEPREGGPQDSPTVEALCYAPFANDPWCPTPDLAAHVPQYVDMQGLLTEMVSDAFQANGDALLTKGKNFYFADFQGGRPRMYFPWDRDSSLSGGAVNQAIYPANGKYATLLGVPEFRAEYNRIFNDLICGPWSEARLHAFVDAVEPVLAGALAADPNNQFGDPADRFDSLRAWLTQRIATVSAQLEGFDACPTVQLALNELMATNVAWLEDPDEPGAFPDWFELRSLVDEVTDLGGLYLTDDLTNPTKYQIPNGVSIPPNGHLVFYADEDGTQGPLHVSFRLGGGGEELAIYDRDGVRRIDAVTFGAQLPDIAFGRFPDGVGAWGLMATPTPGSTNGPHNAPPSIAGVARAPLQPGASDVVTVTAAVVDPDGAVTSVVLLYDAGSGWVETPMLDDGASGDGDAGDAVYGGSIPAQAADIVVKYYIMAVDDTGASARDPRRAPELAHAYVVGYLPPALYINEYMAANGSAIEDPDEPLAFEDWLELYNPGPLDVDLGGMYLTDDLESPRKFAIPAGVTIGAGGHLLFWADDEPLQGPQHVGFKLSAGGEQIGLFDTDTRGNVPIDSRVFGVQTTNVSEGRCPDGAPEWQSLAAPTPGAANGDCSSGPAACCLPLGECQDVEAGACAAAGGRSQGAESSCAATGCPECVVDEDCDDGILCTLDACSAAAGTCLSTPYDAVCQDGLFCNGAEWCGPTTGCNEGAAPCEAGSCDEATDLCAGLHAGAVPDRRPGVPLTLERTTNGIRLSWGVSCLAGDTDYAVYEGSLGDFDSHSARLCTTDGLLEAGFNPGSGDRYYLLVPHNGASEGSYGHTSDGMERPPALAACLAQSVGVCPP